MAGDSVSGRERINQERLVGEKQDRRVEAEHLVDSLTEARARAKKAAAAFGRVAVVQRRGALAMARALARLYEPDRTGGDKPNG